MGLLQNSTFVTCPMLYFPYTFLYIRHFSCLYTEKCTHFYENADGYFDYLTSVQVWNNPPAMYMDKENTLWKLSCVLLTRAKRAKCHAACKLFELCEFFARRM